MAARGGGEHVYATLLLNDTYLPGALVLAHSLRDAGTSKKLAVLVTLETVSTQVITQLKTVYDHVIPVSPIRNDRPANLYLMNRPDLHSTFTKVNLWKQTQFAKIVYIDADVVAYRAPDELFDLEAAFSAAPDIGWPDLFNTGVMVLSPNLGDYYALIAMAERGISFDGADQGLLNMHFKNNYNRISFTYNVTPSAHYQYLPAYCHFQSSINMVHFIGSEKPWFQGRDANKGDSPYEQMFGRWWAVYDRHYRVSTTPTPPPPSSAHPASSAQFSQGASIGQESPPEIVQYFTRGEFQPQPPQASTGEPHLGSDGILSSPSSLHSMQGLHEQHYQTHKSSGQSQQVSHKETYREHPYHDHHAKPPHHDAQLPPVSKEYSGASPGPQAEARAEQVPANNERDPPPPEDEQKQEPVPTPVNTWDAQRYPPPADSKPEAINFPLQVYEMSRDPAPFVPPKRYPSPPRDMWYEVPKEKPAPPAQKPKAIFPWEQKQPIASRVFGEPPEAEESPSSPAETATVNQTSQPVAPATPTIKISPSDPWTAFTRSNAWDEVPEIERYVEGLQMHRRTQSQGKTDAAHGQKVAQERGLRLTDFPSVVDRPSLPVTPAPIRRPKFWGSGDPNAGKGEDDEELPAAEGVPPQTDWDPVAQLQKLAKQQSEALLRRLSTSEDGAVDVSSHDAPIRSVPPGSEGLVSTANSAHATSGEVLSPQPVKGRTTTSMVRGMGSDQYSANAS